MPNKAPENANLSSWLSYIDSVHPRNIELGLDRVRNVFSAMNLSPLANKVVIVAGTNGKGSCIATMESILVKSGYSVGSYTSPHIKNFSERIKLNAIEYRDMQLCQALEAVESSRNGVTLSYFEFATLAAFFLFSRESLDFALLEVGLGGRLDAVNIVDADVAIISSIALDHQDWLGEDLESIAKEKAGIIRSKVPLIYGDKQPLKAITEKAEILNAPLFLAEREVGWKRDEDLLTWHWEGMDKGEKVKLSHLPLPSLALSNVSLAMQALFLFEIKIDRGVLNSALSQLFLPGRFEKRRDKLTSVRVIFDVAHNPESAKLLGRNLIEEKNNHNNVCQISAVIAVMADKDVEGIVVALDSSVDKWYLTEVSDPRCMTAAELGEQVSLTSVGKICTSEQPIFESYNQACKEAETYGIRHPGKETAVLVTGSFHTVSALRDLSFQGD